MLHQAPLTAVAEGVQTSLEAIVGGPTAVAEKVSALQTAAYFTDRQARANFKAFDKIMKPRGGTKPRQGDEMPS